ncbi:MAG: hypothetical protein U5R31_17825 [Acidimicrobiia bacterium]|nr:hypothetical protein [Acidimicrobiia bacterium]
MGGEGVEPNFETVAGTFGGQSDNWWQMRQNATASSDLQATFSFSESVDGVCFTFYDVDLQTGTGWEDVLEVTSSPSVGFTFTQPPGGTVTGSGTPADPFVGGSNVPSGDDTGNVTLVFNDPITSFSVTYTNGDLSGSIQHVGISNIEFCTP